MNSALPARAPRAAAVSAATSDQPPLREMVAGAVRQFLDLHGANAPTGLHGIVLREVEAPLFAEVMRYCGDNQTRAAELLGMTRATLRKKLREYGLAG